jgi:hypothetical protein
MFSFFQQNIPLGSVGLGILSETLIANASLSEIVVDVIHPSARDVCLLSFSLIHTHEYVQKISMAVDWNSCFPCQK